MKIITQLAFSSAMLGITALSAASNPVNGDIVMPKEWTVFVLPQGNRNYQPLPSDLNRIPEFILCGNKKIMP